MKRKSKNVEDSERFAKQSAMTLKELYPNAHYRLATLVDGDDQLSKLMQVLEGEGMPFGSEFWPGFCKAFLLRLLAERSVLTRLLLDKEDPDRKRAEADMEQARAMYVKRKPKTGAYECHFCGHRDARPINSHIALCPQCEEELK